MPELIEFSFSKTEKNTFFDAMLLNCKPEEFFISVPPHNFWFQKVEQLVVQTFKQLIYSEGA